jgi:hypothetical protein
MSPDWMTGLTLKSKIAFAAAKGASSCLKHERYGPATPNIHIDQVRGSSRISADDRQRLDLRLITSVDSVRDS